MESNEKYSPSKLTKCNRIKDGKSETETGTKGRQTGKNTTKW